MPVLPELGSTMIESDQQPVIALRALDHGQSDAVLNAAARAMVIREMSTRVRLPIRCVFLMLAATAVRTDSSRRLPGAGPRGAASARKRTCRCTGARTRMYAGACRCRGRGILPRSFGASKVFITQAIEKEHLRRVMCFRRSNGEPLWQAGPVWAEKRRAANPIRRAALRP